MKVKQQSFGFGRARSNFSSSNTTSIASSSFSSLLGHRNADSALFGSGGVAESDANLSNGGRSVPITTTSGTNGESNGSSGTLTNTTATNREGGEVMDVSHSGTQIENSGVEEEAITTDPPPSDTNRENNGSSGILTNTTAANRESVEIMDPTCSGTQVENNRVEEEAMTIDPPGSVEERSSQAETIASSSGSVRGVSEEMATTNPSTSVEDSDQVMVTSVNTFEEGSIQAMATNPSAVDGPAVSGLSGNLGEECGCSHTTEPEANAENKNDTLKAQSTCTPNSDREVKSEPSPVLSTIDHSYAGTVEDSAAQAGTSNSTLTSVSQNELVADSISTSSSNSNSIGMGMGANGVSNSESNTSQWNGIRTRRQIQFASNDNTSQAENSQQRQEQHPQDLAPEGQPLALLPQRGDDRDEGQVNIMDVDESSQDSQNMLSSLVYSLGLTEHETKQAISLWHNRTIIPQLDPADIGAELAKRRQLYREEQENFEEQSRKAELLELPVSESSQVVYSFNLASDSLNCSYGQNLILPHPHTCNILTYTVTSFSVAVAVDKKAKILCGQLSNRCTTCRRFD